MKKRLWTLVLAMIMAVTLLPTLASASAAPVAMEIPTDAQVKEVGTWDELVIGIADISAAGDYYFKITDDLTADSTIKLPGGTAKIEYAVYIYCAADHSIGRAVTFSDPMFIMGNNGPCNAVVTLAFGGINGGSLTISDSGVISTGVIYGYGGIGANSAVELYDGVIFEDNGISNSLWEFSGWKAADGTIYTSDELADLTIEQDSTFTAQYASKNQETYIVSFDRGTTQGSITGVTEFNVPSGESLNSMNYAVPGQSTFGTVVFDCWEDSYGDYYSSEQIAALEITEDMNFIARWKLNTGEISIYFKNEYLDYPKSSNDWSFINVQTGSKLDSSNPPAAKQRAGYDFVGWMSTNGTFYTQEELMAKEFYHTESFVAKFTRNDGNVSVSFDSGNHGSISSKDIIISKGSTIADSGENVPAVKPASATTGGALIYTIGSSTVVRMYGGEIRNNTSNSSIGGMINTNNFEMYGGKIEHNKVYGVSGNSIAGGGVNCDNLIMKGGSVSYNTLQASAENAVAYGAGLYVGTSAINGYSYKEIQITGGTITGNKGLGYDGTPEGDGGGAYLLGDGVIQNHISFLSLYIPSGVSITNNVATNDGGGIYCGRSNEDITKGRPAYVYVTGGSITGNTAGNAGGGIYNTGAAIISGGTFGNTATALSTSSEVYHSGLTMLEYDPSETWLGVPDDSLVLSGSVDLSGGVYLDTDHVIDVADGFAGKATVDVRNDDTDPDNVDGTYQEGRDVIEFAGEIANEAAAVGLFPLADAVRSSFELVKAADANKILELKTAELETITITPASMTIYMGGESGYDGVTDEDGEIVGNKTLPMPGFTFSGLPDGTDPTDITFSNKEGSSWTVELYPGLPENAQRPLYTITPVPDTDTPSLRLQFKLGDSVVIDDDFEVGSAVNQTLTMSIYPGSLGDVLAEVDGVNYKVACADGKLTVRGTNENTLYGSIDTEPEANVPGVMAEGDGTTFTINGSEVVASANVALLFDDIIEDGDSSERSEALKAAALEQLAEGDWNFELKYLDLVDRSNGDAWVAASGPVTVYWPRPEDAPEDAEFVLLHFKGLHRSGEEDYELVTVELTPSENGEHLCFSIGSAGFSPFALAWTSPEPDEPDVPDIPDLPPYIPPVEPSEPEYVPDWLNTEDHYAYIIGYEDGSIRPNGSITRAEACTIINRTLGRAPEAGHLLPEAEMNVWPDNPAGTWFYAEMQEATNSHEYKWLGDIEQWLEKLPERDWSGLE